MSEDNPPPPGSEGRRECESAGSPASEPPADAPRRLPWWLQILGLLVLPLIAYWPVLSGGFVWDDAVLIDRNSLVTGEATLLTIWFREDFPLSLVALWLQWLAWGKNATGYHVVNVLLHAVSVLLLWRLLARLIVRGAWFGAALFAVHPVAVASVAWISELKNTLSLVFFLLALLCYLRFEAALCGAAGIRNPKSEIRHRKWYWLSLAAFLLALLSKTSTVMLPVVLLGCAWWRRGRITKYDALQASPFFALALAFGLLTTWFQVHHVLTDHPVTDGGFAGRLAGAGWALWFYLGKALLPLNLAMIYPRWEIHVASPAAWLPLAAWLAMLAACWRLRQGWGRHGLFALGSFTVLLLPVLGFFDTYFFSMSRVSDHFAYLALLPAAALVGAVLSNAQHSTSNIQRSTPKWLVAAGVICALMVLTMQRARVLATDEELWHDTLAKNPAAWVAHNNLGCILAEQGKLDEAAKHFESSLQANPRNAEAHRNLGKALVIQEQFARAEEHLRSAVQLNPKDAEAQRSLASALMGLGKPAEAIAALRTALRITPDAGTRIELANILRATGDVSDAIAQLRLAVAGKSESAEALSNLAWLLATSADASLRNGTDAVQFAERACRLTGETNAILVATRAAAYAEAERFDDAVASAQKAIELANASGNAQFAKLNQQLLRLYAARLPYHEPPNRR